MERINKTKDGCTKCDYYAFGECTYYKKCNQVGLPNLAKNDLSEYDKAKLVLAIDYVNKALKLSKSNKMRIVVLPCDIGDKFYTTDPLLHEVEEHECCGFTIDRDRLVLIDGNDCRWYADEVDYDKEFAEKKAKELRGDNYVECN